MKPVAIRLKENLIDERVCVCVCVGRGGASTSSTSSTSFRGFSGRCVSRKRIPNQSEIDTTPAFPEATPAVANGIGLKRAIDCQSMLKDE